ncbi:30814_t:CDS:1, partial [Gigaspora margarita]
EKELQLDSKKKKEKRSQKKKKNREEKGIDNGEDPLEVVEEDPEDKRH